MAVIKVVLRYFPVGHIAGPAEKITLEQLGEIASDHGIAINIEEIKGKEVSVIGGNFREETMNSPIEQVSQSVITVTSENETALRIALTYIIKKYRAPRTVFGAWGSDEKGKAILSEICDAEDGWR